MSTPQKPSKPRKDGAGTRTSGTTKTTVYLDAGDYRRLRSLARTQGRTTAAVVREAIARYAAGAAATTRPSSIGAGRSGRRDLSVRAEHLLRGMGRRR